MEQNNDGKVYKRTDWTAYYNKKKSWFSIHTQRYTYNVIIQAIKKYIKLDYDSLLIVAELGGGNSCFAKDICKASRIHTYDIYDNNELAVRLFNEQNLNVISNNWYLQDLTEKENEYKGNGYDFVFSIGLIEHFRGSDIETIIRKHFEFCRDGGWCL